MAVTSYIWDAVTDCCLMETDGNDTTTAVYTNEPNNFGRVVSQNRGDNAHYYNCDGQESVRQMTNAGENVTDSYAYQSFGELVASSVTNANPFRYIGALGYYFDSESEATYVRARTYDSSVVRWMSKDPIPFSADSASSYLYCRNNPVGRQDPSGLLCITCSRCNCDGPPKITHLGWKLVKIPGTGEIIGWHWKAVNNTSGDTNCNIKSYIRSDSYIEVTLHSGQTLRQYPGCFWSFIWTYYCGDGECYYPRGGVSKVPCSGSHSYAKCAGTLCYIDLPGPRSAVDKFKIDLKFEVCCRYEVPHPYEHYPYRDEIECVKFSIKKEAKVIHVNPELTYIKEIPDGEWKTINLQSLDEIFKEACKGITE